MGIPRSGFPRYPPQSREKGDPTNRRLTGLARPRSRAVLFAGEPQLRRIAGVERA